MNHLIKFLFLSLAVCSCVRPESSQDSKFFNTYVKERIATLDPAMATDVFSQHSLMQVYEGLLHYNYIKRPLELEPLLAESMPTITNNGLTYTFKIKKGVKFQDDKCFPKGVGRELVASDFIYSWKRLVDPSMKSENYWVFRGKIKGLDAWREAVRSGQANYETPVEGLQTPDPHTLVIHLVKVDYLLLYLLAGPNTPVIPHEAVKMYGAEFASHPVGTGAFQMESWVRGSKLKLIKNPTYREVLFPEGGDDAGKRLPLLEGIVINEVVEEQPQWLGFQKGDLDIVFTPKDYIDVAIKDKELKPEFAKKGMKLQLAPSTDIVYISFNTENRFLKNKKLRQAMSLAYDKQSLLYKFFGGMGLPAQGPIPPNVPSYREQKANQYVNTDLEKAKAKLIEAGYPGGKGLPEFTFDLGSGHSTARQIAELFQQRMALVGIKVKIRINTWSQFSEKVKKKQSDIFDMSWNGDYPDAENFLQLFYSKNASPGPNNSNFKNAQYDEMYEQALLMPPGQEKYLLYQKMEDLLIEEVPWIFNIHRVRVLIYQGWLKNFRYEHMIFDAMKYYDIDAQQKEQLKKAL